MPHIGICGSSDHCVQGQNPASSYVRVTELGLSACRFATDRLKSASAELPANMSAVDFIALHTWLCGRQGEGDREA